MSVKNDKQARRVVAGVTGENKLIFLVFYDNNQYYSGPYLNDLPDLVDKTGKSLDLNIADAINLDGGSASAFISDDIKLTELTPVGSFFCISNLP